MTHRPITGRQSRLFNRVWEAVRYSTGYSAQQLGLIGPSYSDQFYTMGVLDAKEDAKKPTFDQMLEGVCQ